MPEKETAYELKPDSGLTSTDGVHFGGTPGVYRPGEPVAPSDTGHTPDELAEIVKEQGVPLEKTTGRAAKASSSRAAPVPDEGKG